jgi:hypothetical protein
MLAYGMAQDGVHLLCFGPFFWLHSHPQGSGGGEQGWKSAVRTAFLPFASVCRFFSFPFLFLLFFVCTVHHAIHTLHPDPARSRPAPLLYRDGGGEDVSTCAYRYSWFWSLGVQRPILLQLTHILYTSCVVPTSSLRSTR